MKFNKHLPEDVKEFLTEQLNEYIKVTPMSKSELRAVKEWVKDGHSVYENTSMSMYDGQIPVEFLTEWREEEYIRKQTKGMSSEETQKFAMNFYGWGDGDSDQLLQDQQDHCYRSHLPDTDEELPFS